MTQPALTLINEEYAQFCVFLQEASGIVLGEGKHYLVNSRLNHIIEAYQLSSYHELIDEMKKTSNLRQQVIDAMTTNETLWFRDKYPFDILYNRVFPHYAKRQGRPLRIWSAACSTGQEAYSISMLFHEYCLRHPGSFNAGVTIIGTDIAKRVLAEAAAGRYFESALTRGLSAERKQRYLKPVASMWEVKTEIKHNIQFKFLNLQDSYTGLGKFDVIFCRNVLIYFSSEFKTDILERMSLVLNPDGYIMLGSSEAPCRYTDVYSMSKTPYGVIYQRQK